MYQEAEAGGLEEEFKIAASLKALEQVWDWAKLEGDDNPENTGLPCHPFLFA